MSDFSTTNVQEWRGATVVDRDGDKLGRVEDIFLDIDTNQPEWVLVNTGLFGKNQTFVPLANATRQGDQIRVAYDKAKVKDAPNMEPGRELSQEEEARLYEYYGMGYSEARSGTGLPEGGAPERGGRTDDAMTRSEEELRVGTQRREAGRVRLKKYVTTEQETVTVPVQREEVRVEREPITDANVDRATAGPDITESEHEVTLMEEQPVVQKEVVPKERVRLDKDAVTEQETVSEELRKEQVDVEGAGRPERRRDR